MRYTTDGGRARYAGNQIGSKFWEVISDEHGIDPAFLASNITEERADENRLQGMQDVMCSAAGFSKALVY